MLSNFWKRPVNQSDPKLREGDPLKDAVRGGSILKDVAIWLGWMLVALVGIAVMLLPGWFGS